MEADTILCITWVSPRVGSQVYVASQAALTEMLVITGGQRPQMKWLVMSTLWWAVLLVNSLMSCSSGSIVLGPGPHH